MATYTIDSKAELLEFNTQSGKFNGIAYEDNVFNLTVDVDLVGETWVPIVGFNGYFNGQGFTVSNLTINNPSTDNQGFFGDIAATGKTDAALVKNLGLADVNIIGEDSVGAFAGRTLNMTAAKPVENCWATGSVSGREYVGGMVGLSNASHYLNCYVDVHVTGGKAGETKQDVGGFFGNVSGTSVTAYCFSKGEVTYIGIGDGSKVGGFIGGGGSTETACYWDTETSKQATSQGGEVGYTTANMKVQANYRNWDSNGSYALWAF